MEINWFDYTQPFSVSHPRRRLGPGGRYTLLTSGSLFWGTTAFPQGLFEFTAQRCTPGGTVNLTITYTTLLPAGPVYWKYGPTPANTTAHWYQLPATITGNTATFSITDGQVGDNNLTVDGIIVDPSGPGIPSAPAATDIPTLSEWAMGLLLGILLSISSWRIHRRDASLNA